LKSNSVDTFISNSRFRIQTLKECVIPKNSDEATFADTFY